MNVELKWRQQKMIKPEEIKDKAKRKYKEFLKNEIDIFFANKTEDFFPLVIRGDTGSVNDDLLKRQKDLQLLISKSKNSIGKGYSLELEQINSRKYGEQTDVKKIYFEDKTQFLDFIGEVKSYNRFLEACTILKQNTILSKDQVCSWTQTHISDLLIDEEDGFWKDICLCAEWLERNQNSNLYIREIKLPVHSKFIESNTSLIKSLTSKSNSELCFEETFGLRAKPALIRIRSLDANHPINLGGIGIEECTIPISDLNKLPASFYDYFKKIYIVENEMVFLTFPKVPESICIWGHGFTVNVLKDVSWLGKKELYYFGDLDEHGFEILSTLRRYYPKIQSFCMTCEIFNKYEKYVVKGVRLSGNIVPENLTTEEMKFFMEIRNASIEASRLEQERIDNVDIEKTVKLQ